MLDTGISQTFISWLQSILSNNRAHVQLLKVSSCTYYFKKGISQGSVLTPVLFLFYIKVLSTSLFSDSVTTLFVISIVTMFAIRNMPKLLRSLTSTSFTTGPGNESYFESKKSELCSFFTAANERK